MFEQTLSKVRELRSPYWARTEPRQIQTFDIVILNRVITYIIAAAVSCN